MYKFIRATLIIGLATVSYQGFGQVNATVINGKVMLSGDYGSPRADKFQSAIMELDKKLSIIPNDTTALFDKALLLDKLNDMIAVPYQDDPKALKALRSAAGYADRSDSLGMKSLKLKVLRAQIYKDLAYRFLGDQAWKYNGKQIANRKNSFITYKKKANDLYEQLAKLDPDNAYDYQKLKENAEYPID